MASASGQHFLNLLFGGLEKGLDQFQGGQRRGQDLALNLHQMRAQAAADQQKFNLSETTAQRRHEEQLARIGIAQQNANTGRFRAETTANLGFAGLKQDDKHFYDNLSFLGKKEFFDQQRDINKEALSLRAQQFNEKMGMRKLVQGDRKINAQIKKDEALVNVAQSRAESYRLLSSARASGSTSDERLALSKLIDVTKKDPRSQTRITESAYEKLPEDQQLQYSPILGDDEVIRYVKPNAESQKNIDKWMARLEELGGASQPGPVADPEDIDDIDAQMGELFNQ